MDTIFNDVNLSSMIFNGYEVESWIHNDIDVFALQRSYTVTYQVDPATGTSYTEEVKNGESVLSPITFTPTKRGYEFVGWREDTSASSSVIANKLMEDGPITLYAVFRKTITVTYYNGSTSASSTSTYRYYNNGNVNNPSFTLTQSDLSGWTARGWSTSTAGNGSITYNNGASFTRDSDITLYGMYYQTISLFYNGNGNTSGSTASQSGTRYYNSNGNVVNPSFTLSSNGFSKSGYSFSKWAFGSTSGTQYAAGSVLTLSASNTMYAVWSVIYTSTTATYTAGSTQISLSDGIVSFPTFSYARSINGNALSWSGTNVVANCACTVSITGHIYCGNVDGQSVGAYIYLYKNGSNVLTIFNQSNINSYWDYYYGFSGKDHAGYSIALNAGDTLGIRVKGGNSSGGRVRFDVSTYEVAFSATPK